LGTSNRASKKDIEKSSANWNKADWSLSRDLFTAERFRLGKNETSVETTLIIAALLAAGTIS
jgi:hypothetical protein